MKRPFVIPTLMSCSVDLDFSQRHCFRNIGRDERTLVTQTFVKKESGPCRRGVGLQVLSDDSEIKHRDML